MAATPGAEQSQGATQRSVEELAARARPSVVMISHFGRDGKEDGIGAGFVISSNGLIATSLHVIGEGRRIAVRTSSGKEYEVSRIHAWDRKHDLAVMKVEAENLPALELGDSDALEQGTRVVAMGSPLGLEYSVVEGIVSAKREFDGVELIQLAIPIEPGNSGGPLLDRQGRVQGLLNMKSALTPNLGFATPVNALQSLLEKPNPVAMERWVMIGALDPKEWTPMLGAQWRQKAGHIRVEGLGKGFGGRSLCLSQRIVPERPYEIAATVRMDDESGAAGLIFCSDGEQRHYGFYPTAGQLRLTRFEGPDVYSWTILDQAKSVHYRRGEWNTIKVRHEPDRILCYVNGHLVFESTDEALAPGRVGLAKFRDTRADFRNFALGTNLVVAAAPPAALVERLSHQIGKPDGKSPRELLTELEPHSDVAQPLLVARAGELEQQAAQLRDLAQTLHLRAVQEKLVRLLEEPEERADLFHASLLVALLDNPELDLEVYRQQLEKMAAEIRHLLPDTPSPDTIAGALTKFLFVENGFHGSRSDYYNRANSYMSDVLDDREGSPISLSVLFVEMAHRLGLKSAADVSLPGHFVVKYLNDQGREQLVDVFAGGKLMSREDAEVLVAESGSVLREQHLKAATRKEVIVRILRNLLRSAQNSVKPLDVSRYLDVILALSPDAVVERRTRAMLRLQKEDRAGAREDLKWFIDNEPPGVDLESVVELYHSLTP